MRHRTFQAAFAVLLALGVLAGAIAVMNHPASPSGLPRESVTVGGVRITAEIASTPAEREQGLSGRASLPPETGMLFVFDEPGHYAFWMKDMRFPIDIIWAGPDGRVVHIEENLSPETYPNSFSSALPAQYVLEVPAGFAQAHAVQLGSTLVIGA